MTRFRNALPQVDGGLFITDGGLETTLIFQHGLELPDFAAFALLNRPGGDGELRRYFDGYAAIAKRLGAGMVLESVTWRASRDWGVRLGYDAAALASVNRRAVEFLEEIRAELWEANVRSVISGCVGPRGDGYDPGIAMSAAMAQAYHSAQIETFAGTAADMVTAITMNYVDEGIGIARAARAAGMPVAISFTVETDGRLPTGQSLGDAIEETDAVTSAYPAYYMVNCAHPTHFSHLLGSEPWTARIRGLRVNASTKSHAELNESTTLDDGDPVALGALHAEIKRRLPQLSVLGGCCGTDHRHVEQIAEACMPLFGVVAGRPDRSSGATRISERSSDRPSRP
jgi:S-methylmethionine-dependent homocysteine/selenocysteine methylase